MSRAGARGLRTYIGALDRLFAPRVCVRVVDEATPRNGVPRHCIGELRRARRQMRGAGRGKVGAVRGGKRKGREWERERMARRAVRGNVARVGGEELVWRRAGGRGEGRRTRKRAGKREGRVSGASLDERRGGRREKERTRRGDRRPPPLYPPAWPPNGPRS